MTEAVSPKESPQPNQILQAVFAEARRLGFEGSHLDSLRNDQGQIDRLNDLIDLLNNNLQTSYNLRPEEREKAVRDFVLAYIYSTGTKLKDNILFRTPDYFWEKLESRPRWTRALIAAALVYPESFNLSDPNKIEPQKKVEIKFNTQFGLWGVPRELTDLIGEALRNLGAKGKNIQTGEILTLETSLLKMLASAAVVSP